MKNPFSLILLFLQFLFVSAQQNKIDSLVLLIKNDKQDTNKINHLNSLSRAVISSSYDSAIVYANTALKLSQQLNPQYKRGIANAYNNIGIANTLQGNISNAHVFFLKALELDKELNDSVGMAKRLCNIGIIYENYGEYAKALDYYFKALEIDERIKEKKEIASVLGNIGNIYAYHDDFNKAFEYFFRRTKIEQELGNRRGEAINFGNIGSAYSDQAQLTSSTKEKFVLLGKARDYYFKALHIEEQLEGNDGIDLQLLGIANTYREQSEYSNALDYYFKALKIAEEMGNKPSIAIILLNIGVLYNRTGDFKDAEKYLVRGLQLAKEIEDPSLELSYEQALSDLYAKTNKYELSLEHLKKSITLKDSVFSQENKKQMVRKEMNYEFEKREALAKAEQDKKDAVTIEEKRKQKIITYSVSGGLFLVLLLAIFIFRGYRQKQKANEELAEKNTLIEKSKHIIEEKNKDITDSINYARRIQKAMLPHRKDIWAAFPQSFVLYKPKDIVSGDFYFFHKDDRCAFIASADCTGHGVPGAFMSMIGAGKLNDAVAQSTDTSEILSLLNKGVKSALKQSETDESATRDGMDIALCYVDTVNRIVKYAGANRPIWIIRKGSTAVEEIKATKKAIGGFTENSQHFDSHEIKLNEGDSIYLSTDGYADTFGKDGKKMMTKRFKDTLLSIQDKTMKEQEKYLDDFVENWKAGVEQVDDILVIGVRL